MKATSMQILVLMLVLMFVMSLKNTHRAQSGHITKIVDIVSDADNYTESAGAGRPVSESPHVPGFGYKSYVNNPWHTITPVFDLVVPQWRTTYTECFFGYR